MDDMKFRFRMMWVVAFLALGAGAAATTYYINDGSTVGDVYCTQLGNNANNGRTPSTPKLIEQLASSTNLLPGVVVLIDTGIYTDNVVIGTNVNRAAGSPSFHKDRLIPGVERGLDYRLLTGLPLKFVEII